MILLIALMLTPIIGIYSEDEQLAYEAINFLQKNYSEEKYVPVLYILKEIYKFKYFNGYLSQINISLEMKDYNDIKISYKDNILSITPVYKIKPEDYITIGNDGYIIKMENNGIEFAKAKKIYLIKDLWTSINDEYYATLLESKNFSNSFDLYILIKNESGIVDYAKTTNNSFFESQKLRFKFKVIEVRNDSAIVAIYKKFIKYYYNEDFLGYILTKEKISNKDYIVLKGNTYTLKKNEYCKIDDYYFVFDGKYVRIGKKKNFSEKYLSKIFKIKAQNSKVYIEYCSNNLDGEEPIDDFPERKVSEDEILDVNFLEYNSIWIFEKNSKKFILYPAIKINKSYYKIKNKEFFFKFKDKYIEAYELDTVYICNTTFNPDLALKFNSYRILVTDLADTKFKLHFFKNGYSGYVNVNKEAYVNKYINYTKVFLVEKKISCIKLGFSKKLYNIYDDEKFLNYTSKINFKGYKLFLLGKRLEIQDYSNIGNIFFIKKDDKLEICKKKNTTLIGLIRKDKYPGNEFLKEDMIVFLKRIVTYPKIVILENKSSKEKEVDILIEISYGSEDKRFCIERDKNKIKIYGNTKDDVKIALKYFKKDMYICEEIIGTESLFKNYSKLNITLRKENKTMNRNNISKYSKYSTEKFQDKKERKNKIINTILEEIIKFFEKLIKT